MIHHLARALAVRHNTSALAAAGASEPGSAQRPASQQPVRPRPLTPWGTPPRGTLGRVIDFPRSAQAPFSLGVADHQQAHAVRISVDPQDARRTVIAGKFAEVCAALDRLVLEQEALA
jgi:hypothetical protein